MTFDETTVLLAFIHGIDKQFVFNEQAISAWANVLGPTITLEDAMQFAKDHYLESDRRIMPAHIVGRHRIARRAQAIDTPKPEPTHDCMDGWILVEEQTPLGHTYSAASPCPQCTISRQQSARM